MKEIAERPLFALVGFDVVQRAFGDGETFSSRIHNETIGLVWGETLLGMDGAAHRLNRGLITQAFTKNAVARWEREIVEPVVAGLIDRFVDDGQGDLMPRFTALFPVYVIAAMLGLPREDVPRFTGWAADTITVFHDRPRGLEASRLLGEYLDQKIDERRAAPGDDLISLLIGAELDGRRLDNAETTFRSSSSLLVGLLGDPDALHAVRDDRELVPTAIEEALRWEAPLTSVNRIATRDSDLAGRAIPEGAIVECSMGGANRDPARWDEPDRFDIRRPPRPHLAFAHGPHTCIGMHLARMETRVALGALLDRLPGVHLDPEAERPEMRGLGFRQPTSIRARW
jgi:cytochrome P450